MVNYVIKTLKQVTQLNGVRFNVRISKQLHAKVLGDHERMRRVLFSVLQNVAFESRAGSVVEIDLQTKPLAIDVIDQTQNSQVIDILDYSMLIVCSVSYEHHA